MEESSISLLSFLYLCKDKAFSKNLMEKLISKIHTSTRAVLAPEHQELANQKGSVIFLLN